VGASRLRVNRLSCRQNVAFIQISPFSCNYIQDPAEIPDDLVTAASGTVGVGNLSLSVLLARLKAFQLPWSAGL
jgi:hypothetical protein